MLSQYEILKYAQLGICSAIEREIQINERTKRDCGHESQDALANISKLKEARMEVHYMIHEIESGITE